MLASDGAEQIWRDQGARLLAMRGMTDADWMIFESYVLAAWRMRAAAMEIARDGVTVADENGTLRRHPATGVATESERALRSAAAELGLSPSSRRKVVKVQAAASDDDADFA